MESVEEAGGEEEEAEGISGAREGGVGLDGGVLESLAVSCVEEVGGGIGSTIGVAKGGGGGGFNAGKSERA